LDDEEERELTKQRWKAVKLKREDVLKYLSDFKQAMMLVVGPQPTEFEKERKPNNDREDVPDVSTVSTAYNIGIAHMGTEKSFDTLETMIIKHIEKKRKEKRSDTSSACDGHNLYRPFSN